MSKGLTKFMKGIMNLPASKRVEDRRNNDTLYGPDLAKKEGIPDAIYAEYLRRIFTAQENAYNRRNPRQSVHPGTEDKPFSRFLPGGSPSSSLYDFLEQRALAQYPKDQRLVTREDDEKAIAELDKADKLMQNLTKNPKTRINYEDPADTYANMLKLARQSEISMADLHEYSPGKFKISSTKEQEIQDNANALKRYYAQINLQPELGAELLELLKRKKILSPKQIKETQQQ